MASVVIAGDVSGTCTLQAANAAGTTVLSLPTTSGTLVATGGAPSFTTVTTGLGNASAPSITFTGDTNTGIFSPTADTIAFTEGGVESMRIDSSGNVGIGTNNPTRILDIAAANPGGGGGLRVTATTGTNGALMQVSNTGGNFYHAIDTSAGGTFGSAYSANIWYDGNYPMRFATNNQVQMAITGAGLFQMNSGYGSVATAYGCRAWISFNGSSGAINGSGNVSSVSNNATGDWTINFSTSMPDGNYSIVGMVRSDNDSNPAANPAMRSSDSPAAGSCRVFFGVSNSRIAFTLAMFAVFR